MFKTIYTNLKNKGHDVYSIGQHQGICTGPYIVIKENIEVAVSDVITSQKVELLLYYPLGEYSKVNDFINSIKEDMKELRLKDTNTPYPIIIDDDKQAYMTSISYKINRKRVL